jgi:hypothetical protein
MRADTFTDAPNTDDIGLQWICVSEAAARLRVSERTIRRRCESGQLAARRVASPSGLSWQIDPSKLRTGADRPSDTPAIGADTRNETGIQNTPEAADAAAKVRTGAAIAADTLTAHLLEENRRLWLALEAAQQSEAVTKAALREALKSGPKQLAQGTDEGARIGAEREQSGAANTVPDTMMDAPKSAPLTYGEIADLIEARMNQ